MKQLPLTENLIAKIKNAVGEDVDPTGFAVFEAIAINTNPLPGKDGTLFEQAEVTALTLRQMQDHIQKGGHLPLISDHKMSGEPSGRVFWAELSYADDGQVELRVLFYLDNTETRLIKKLNSGSLDEVSVSFLSSEFKCSACGWDYFSEEATTDNLFEMTCGNGHTIGEDGVHAVLNGLSEFYELSLVIRGAAKEPKIVGPSSSKLQALAANGFEVSGLVCQATAGEDRVSDISKLTTDLVDARTELGVLKAEHATTEAALTAAQEEVTELTATVAERDQTIADLQAASEDNRAEEADAAIAYLTSVVTKLYAATDKDAGNLPTTVAELTALIDDETKGLTALIPAGGSGADAPNTEPQREPASLSAFKTRR